MTPTEELRQLRRDLIADTKRWLPELHPELRSTLWHGVLDKAAKEADQLYKLCAEAAVARAQEVGEEMLERISKGKPLSRLTMGERMDLIKTLDRQRRILPDARLLAKKDRYLLEQLTEMRNRFIHGQIPSSEGPAYAQRFLSLAQQLCDTRLVQVLIATDD